MKILVSKFIKLSVFTFIFAFGLVSCEKENSDIVKDDVVQTITPQMTLTIGSRTIQNYAYATYCEANGKIFFNVSNNQALLDSSLVSDDFKVDDFLINYEKVGTQVNTIGGASFTENLGGINITSVVFDPSATITITSADNQLVVGSMTGNFQLLSGAKVPYSVQFTAQVVGVSPWCN